jgi:gamma-glutamylcyclotransferase (GGCT)/AIG2-like uncharacterized protein YtfP
MESTNFLFIYGTLLPGIPGKMSKWLAKNSKVICEGSVQGNLFMVSDYPAAVYDLNSNHLVKGMIVELIKKDYCFSVLDSYEGISETWNVSDEYLRVLRPVLGLDSIVRMCWIYVYNHSTSGLEPILTGDYKEYIKS